MMSIADMMSAIELYSHVWTRRMLSRWKVCQPHRLAPSLHRKKIPSWRNSRKMVALNQHVDPLHHAHPHTTDEFRYGGHHLPKPNPRIYHFVILTNGTELFAFCFSWRTSSRKSKTPLSLALHSGPFAVWSVTRAEASGPSLVGGAIFWLFHRNSITMKKGRHKLFIWPTKVADGHENITTPSKPVNTS
ncbi:hypothetical protein SeLEV6574_g04893 [Synchytrium endobioticum]|uniref:Uncharacterized protein n=1 Tax=Synchytrium endobioticum TaxID=286115 RepID=A0A507CXG7_9FUNG|nr:hypothetical protein SeLEV6574_g04893 [Synchytrium endobioticum]